MEVIFTIYPPTLFRGAQFGIKVKFLLTLTNSKWPLGIDPGGHHFVVLNVSINKKPDFVPEVVIFKAIKKTGPEVLAVRGGVEVIKSLVAELKFLL